MWTIYLAKVFSVIVLKLPLVVLLFLIPRYKLPRLVYSIYEDFLINTFYLFFFQDMQTLLISDDDEQSVVGDVVERTVAEDDDSAGKVFSYLATSLQDINKIILLFYYRQ